MLTKEKLDQEWIDLMTRAKQMGFSTDDVRVFLQQAATSEKTVAKSGK